MGRRQPKGKREEPPNDKKEDEKTVSRDKADKSMNDLQDGKSRNNHHDNYVQKEKTLVQKAVKIGLITIPLAMYVSWAYKKFFPCPRVKPLLKPRHIKLKSKHSSRTKLPRFCTVIDFMKKRYCTNEAKFQQGIPGSHCRTRFVHKPQDDLKQYDTLKYDVRDESYDRGASGKSKKPFASFYEDDFREEIDKNLQEQVYSKDRYRERKRVQERKSIPLKDEPVIEQENSTDSTNYDDSLRAGVDEQLVGKAPNDKTEAHDECAATPSAGITYCEYLKRPIRDYEYPDFYEGDSKPKVVKETNETPKGSPAVVVKNADSHTKNKDNLQDVKRHEASSGFNITPEIMDSLCQQCIQEFEDTPTNIKEIGEQYSNNNHQKMTNDYCGNNKTSMKFKRKEQVVDASSTYEVEDKYLQEMLNRMKKDGKSTQDSSRGNKVSEKLNVRVKPSDDTCGENFYSNNSDMPFVVKDYTCNSTKSKNKTGDGLVNIRNDTCDPDLHSKMSNMPFLVEDYTNKPSKLGKAIEDCGYEGKESFESRQHQFWHSCDPPKGLRKGCRMSPDSVTCE